jgi:hypothetical protein
MLLLLSPLSLFLLLPLVSHGSYYTGGYCCSRYPAISAISTTLTTPSPTTTLLGCCR